VDYLKQKASIHVHKCQHFTHTQHTYKPTAHIDAISARKTPFNVKSDKGQHKFTALAGVDQTSVANQYQPFAHSEKKCV
jgi:hypothetical protein